MARTITIRFGGDASGATRAAAQTERAISGVQSRVGQITRSVGRIVALGVAFGGAASYAIAFGAAAARAGGAVAALPAFLAAAVAGVLAFRAVTMGLGEAWKATGKSISGGGGSAANTARQVEAAQRQVRAATRALADAQRDALRAQEAVTRARKDEKERLDDLSRSVRDAALDEEEAVLRREDAQRELAEAQSMVARAEQALAKARESGDPTAIRRAEEELAEARRTAPDLIRRADLALRRAILGVDMARDAHEDLAQEQAESAKKGVEGSEAVQDALERQAEAQRRVTEAAERLAEAQEAVAQAGQSAASGGIDPAAEALDRLAPSARRVILTLRELVPAWEGAARAGQDRAWRGVDRDLRRLSGTYLPVATQWLIRMGGAWNTAVRQAAGLLTTRKTVADVGRVLDGTAGLAERLARSIRPIVNGFMQFAAVGSSSLPQFGDWVLAIAERFERWSIAARESGQMQQWISDGTATLRTLWQITTNVLGSVRAIFRAGDDGGSTIESFERGTRAMREWLDSAEGQETVGNALERLRDILGSVAQVLPAVASEGSSFRDTLDVTSVVAGFLADNLDMVAAALPYLAAGLIAAKAAQLGANVAAVASVPIQIAQAVVNARLAKAIRAQTATLRAQTTATVVQDATQKRSVVSTIASRVAMVASTVAAKAMAAAQWLLNAAMSANPIGLVVIAIVALVAAIVIAYQRCETFRKIVDAALRAVGQAGLWLWNNVFKLVFEHMKRGWTLVANVVTWWWRNVVTPAFQAVSALVVWLKDRVVQSFNNWRVLFNRVAGWVGDLRRSVVERFTALLDWVKELPGKLRSRLAPVERILTAPFRAAFNAISRLWNSTVGQLSFTVPSWVGPPFAGKGFSMPKLPTLAKGGIIRATPGGTLAIIGEGGQDEAVAPLSRLASMIEDAVRTGGGAGPAGPAAVHAEVRVFVGTREITDIVDVQIEQKTREQNRQTLRRVIAGAGRAR